ncbi:MAG: 2Fe-2S iron-sulfur cluster binding domain-containing protein [Thauera sp.]|nr:2Fe-2S iron-sulfur cluster binding domain-containing protein [Thauera sp.]
MHIEEWSVYSAQSWRARGIAASQYINNIYNACLIARSDDARIRLHHSANGAARFAVSSSPNEPRFNISISNTGEEYRCSANDNLLKGMEELSRKGIPVGCRGGGCGVCKIKIESGLIRSIKMSRQHVTKEEEAEGIVLACRVFPESDITLSVLGKMVKKFELYSFAARPPVAAESLTTVGIDCSSPTREEK